MSRRYYYLPPDPSAAAVAAGLKGSLCPSDADVRIDPATGIVAVTTPGPWRPETLPSGRAVETGLGVAGWALVGSEEIEDGKELDPPEVDALIRAKLAHVDATPVDISKA